MSHQGELSKKFLSEHRNSYELIYDEKTKLPIGAIYLNLGYFTMKEKSDLLTRIAKMVIKEAEK